MREDAVLYEFYSNILSRSSFQVVAEYPLYKSDKLFLVIIDIVTSEKFVIPKENIFVFFEHISLEEIIKRLSKSKLKKKRRKRCPYCMKLREDRLIDIIDDTNYAQQKICIDCYNEKFEPILERIRV